MQLSFEWLVFLEKTIDLEPEPQRDARAAAGCARCAKLGRRPGRPPDPVALGVRPAPRATGRLAADRQPGSGDRGDRRAAGRADGAARRPSGRARARRRGRRTARPDALAVERPARTGRGHARERAAHVRRGSLCRWGWEEARWRGDLELEQRDLEQLELEQLELEPRLDAHPPLSAGAPSSSRRRVFLGACQRHPSWRSAPHSPFPRPLSRPLSRLSARAT